MFNGYKTYIVALLIGLLPIATTVLGGVDWSLVLKSFGVPDPFVIPLATLVAALVMAGMRKLTELTTVKQALATEPPKE